MIKKQLFIWPLLLLLYSCNQWIDLEPSDSLTIENAIENEQDLKKAIRGCYDALQADELYGRMLLVVNDIGSDAAFNGGTIIEYDPFDKNTVEADNPLLNGLWSAAYTAINRCNTALYFNDKLTNIPDENHEIYRAEILFLRSLVYHQLTLLFKDIPLRIEPTFSQENLNLPLTSKTEVLQKLQQDLNFANGKIKNTDSFYVTDLAVKSLLAKVYIELENYGEAIKLLNYIIESDKQLLENYEELYIYEGNVESIFELRFTELLSDKNRLAEFCFPNNLGGRYELAPEPEFLNSFEENDQRLNLFSGDTPYCAKYESLSSGEDNVYIFRLAEIYLLRAEARLKAEGNLSLIRNDINAVRERAGIEPVYTSSPNELQLIIEQEQLHELAFEGKRRSYLVRNNRAKEILDIPVENYYYPIPLSEVNANNEIN